MYERPLAYVCSPLKGEIEANLTKATILHRVSQRPKG